MLTIWRYPIPFCSVAFMIALVLLGILAPLAGGRVKMGDAAAKASEAR